MALLSTITAGARQGPKTAINNKDLYRSAEVEKMLSPGASAENGKEETVYETGDSGSSSVVRRCVSICLGAGLEAPGRASSRILLKVRIFPSYSYSIHRETGHP
jgi:hypothetical protein